MNTVPALGTVVVVTAESHEHQGRAGEVTAFHGIFESVWVRFPAGEATREALIPVQYLTVKVPG